MDCINCITPWKCNGPHLDKISEKLYKTEYGYFLYKNDARWVFLPYEKEFDTDNLLSIMDTLRNLNENHN